MSQEPHAQSRLLTAWNQAALRAYIRQVHCFETDGGSAALDALGKQLDDAFKHVCLRAPQMAGKLSLSKEQPGVIVLHTCEGDQVTRKTCDARGDENLAYARLQRQGFPPGAFVGSVFHNWDTLSEDGPPIPVTQIVLILVDGGILMSVFVHHVVTDGMGVDKFLSAVAAAMRHRDTASPEALSFPSRIDIPVPSRSAGECKDAELAKTLIKQCPELKLAEPGTDYDDYMTSVIGGSEAKFGGIFVFGPRKLRLIKDAVVSAGYPRTPSTFACLAALSWAFMTTARLRAAGIADELREKDGECLVVIPTWWGGRLFQKSLPDYGGNAVATVVVYHGAADLLTIAETPSTDLSSAKGALTRVVRNVEATLAGVNEEYVKTRSTIFNSVLDPSKLQFSFAPSDPRQFFFNSWRRLGADIEWTIPTAAGPRLMHADAVRKSQSEWNESAGLIMPGRQDQQDYEAVLSLDANSMKSLRTNAAWKSWVDREVF